MATSHHILLVGCGKMGGALLRCWENHNLFATCYVVDPQAYDTNGKAQYVTTPDDIPESFTPDLIIAAIKPQAMADIMPAYRKYTDRGAAVLSIAAGTGISFFENIFGQSAKIIRAMPNTPAAIGKGVTVACANTHVTPAEKEAATTLLSAVGGLLWVEDENLLNPVTALSGSGPAYVFLLIETLEKAGIHIGLPPDMARQLARQTVIGAAALAEEMADTPAGVLRENVTSPGGTTEAALAVLMQEALQNIYNQALTAAKKRAEDLAQ